MHCFKFILLLLAGFYLTCTMPVDNPKSTVTSPVKPGGTTVNETPETVYYIAAEGSDSNNGLSPLTPLLTIDPLKSLTLTAHTGIYLKRGGTYNFNLNFSSAGLTPADNLIIGSYGNNSDPLPVLSGRMPLTSGWVNEGGNIWSYHHTDFGNEIELAFINNTKIEIGRYPAAGYLYTDDYNYGDNTNLIYDAALTQPSGYWNQAVVALRPNDWSYQKGRITSFNTGLIVYNHNLSYAYTPLTGYGYCIMNHRNCLTVPDTYAYHPDNKTVYLYSTTDPSLRNVEVSFYSNLIYADHCKNLVIKDIQFTGSNESALYLTGCINPVIKNCRFESSGIDGIRLVKTKSPLVDNNVINNSKNNGITMTDLGENGIFSNNTINKAGYTFGEEQNSMSTAIGIMINTCNGEIQILNNTINGTGYNGISFWRAHCIVSGNYLEDFCHHRDDGGGIYTVKNNPVDNLKNNVSNYGAVISNNTLVDGAVGDSKDTKPPQYGYASHAIYVDDVSQEIEVRNNTVTGIHTTGIFIHNSFRCKVIGNYVHAKVKRALLMRKGGGTTCPVDSNLVQDNILAPIYDGTTVWTMELRFISQNNRFINNKHCLPNGNSDGNQNNCVMLYYTDPVSSAETYCYYSIEEWLNESYILEKQGEYFSQNP